MSEISELLQDLMSGRKPIRRHNPKPGQTGWYYMMPKSDDEDTDYDIIDVPNEDTPNPRLQQTMLKQIRTPLGQTSTPVPPQPQPQPQPRMTPPPPPIPQVPAQPQPQSEPQPQLSGWQKALRTAEQMASGALDGLSLGWADEIEGAASALGYGLASLNSNWNKSGESFVDAMKRGYTWGRDNRRQALANGLNENPILTGGAQVLGGYASPVKAIKYAATAPLSVQNKSNMYNGFINGLAYGAGAGEDNWQDYAFHTATGIGGNMLGHKTANKFLGRAGGIAQRNAFTAAGNLATDGIVDLSSNIYNYISKKF